tara:strand:+ start:157 stop:891 length:735 start_codon:yes stop_codon:yes gene_type:complete
MMKTEQSDDISELAGALATVQAAMRNASKDNLNPHLRTKYADLTSVVGAAQPELGNNGLALMQTAETGEDGQTYLATTLAHKSGQWLRGRMRVEVQASKGLNSAQALGLALTYCRRYSIAAMVCVCTEDDDGHGAGVASDGQAANTSGFPQSKPQPQPPPKAQKSPAPKPPPGHPQDPPAKEGKGGLPYFRYLEKCREIKTRIGEEAYYALLKEFDLGKSNEVNANDTVTMKNVVTALLEVKTP